MTPEYAEDHLARVRGMLPVLHGSEASWERTLKFYERQAYRAVGTWNNGHPYLLAPVRDNHDYWFTMQVVWMLIGSAHRDAVHWWDKWLWLWQFVGRREKELADAQAAWDALEFVKCWYSRKWGVVRSRLRRRGAGDLCTVWWLRDRHYNWLPKVEVGTIDENWLQPAEAWELDRSAPWTLGIPTAVKQARRAAGRQKKAERARKQVLRREWRGLI